MIKFDPTNKLKKNLQWACLVYIYYYGDLTGNCWEITGTAKEFPRKITEIAG